MTKYTEKTITGFKKDIEKIQYKPQMYIGPTDASGIFTLLRECLDNAVDEARAGRNDLVHVRIDSPTGPFWVGDSGVGIPVKKHRVMGISTLTHVLTNLQSSGKSEGGSYKAAIGTHGVGVKATNALSSELEVWTYRQDDGGWFYTKFENGHEVVPVKKAKGPVGPIKMSKGTLIRFTPSSKYFGKAKLDLKQVLGWARMTSYMNSGLLIRVTDGKNQKDFKSKTGIKEYLEKRMVTLKATPMAKVHVFHNSASLEMALAFTDVEGCQVECFTNTVKNVDGGVHADDVYKALYDSLGPVKGKDGKSKFTPTDVRDGLLGVINYKIDAPQFDSQTKSKLVDTRVKGACYQEALEVFSKFWREHPKILKDLITRATELREKTSDFLKDKKLVKNVNSAKKTLITKLAGVVGNTPIENRELFLVEGESAGGGCKKARDKSFQAVYPLRGKPLNVMEAQKDKVNNNKEIVGLLASLGVELDEKKHKGVPTVKYGKIISMADPDVDGKHINCLILGTLWKYIPSLFTDKKVYVVKAPLYKTRYKGKVYFGMSKDDIYKQTGTKNCDIGYIKGYGELSDVDLGVAIDPALRTLYQVLPPKDKQGATNFQLLLGKSPLYRKKLLGVK